MVPAKLAIGGGGGTLAVGSLCFLGIFMVVDGFTGLYVLIEDYSADAAWAVLFAFPALVLSYVLGLLATLGAHRVSCRLRGRSTDLEIEEFAAIASSGNQGLLEMYTAIRQHEILLEGAVIGFGCMAVGAVSATRWLGAFTTFGWVASGGFLVLSLLCPVLSVSLAKQAELLASKAPRTTR